jgi:GxxExxY protein
VAEALHSDRTRMDRETLDRITLAIIQAAIEVHKVLGPGLLESIYLACLLYELRERGLKVVAEQLIPVRYKSLVLQGAYRIDLLVEDAVVVELKCVESVLPVHLAQVRTYLRATEKRVGLLINFNVDYLMKGVKRVVDKF